MSSDLCKQRDTLLTLIRLGIGHPVTILPESIDWEAIRAMAAEQGLSAIVLDGIEKLPEGCRPLQMVLLQWIGETLQGYEYRYELYRSTIAEVAQRIAVI